MPQKPTTRYRRRGLYKSKATQALVIERARAGLSNNKIAKQLRIDRETVARILHQPDVQAAITAAWETIQRQLPAISEMVGADILKKRDRKLGVEVLARAGAFPPKDQRPKLTLMQDNRLQIAIQKLLPHKHQPIQQPNANLAIEDRKQLDSGPESAPAIEPSGEQLTQKDS